MNQLAQRFHVRTPLPELEVIRGKRSAGNQDATIYEMLKVKRFRSMTAEDIQAEWPTNISPTPLLTSIRRSLTNLRKAGDIIEEGKTIGYHGVSITLYRFAPAVNEQFALNF